MSLATSILEEHLQKLPKTREIDYSIGFQDGLRRSIEILKSNSMYYTHCEECHKKWDYSGGFIYFNEKRKMFICERCETAYSKEQILEKLDTILKERLVEVKRDYERETATVKNSFKEAMSLVEEIAKKYEGDENESH